MQQLNPKDIPEIIALVANFYSEERSPNQEELAKLHKFFHTYMGKALEDVKHASNTHNIVPRPERDLAFRSKEVTVKASQENSFGEIQFIVAACSSLVRSEKARDTFIDNAGKYIIDAYKNDGQWVTCFNNFMIDKKVVTYFNNQPVLTTGIFLAIRFSSSMFEPPTIH